MITSQDFSHEYLQYLSKLMAQLDRQSIAKFADLLLDSRESGSTTFFLGNGGSALLQLTLLMMFLWEAGSLINLLELLVCVIIRQ